MENYIASLKCKNGDTYIGLMNRPHCSTNCALHDFKNQPVKYSFLITINYKALLDDTLNNLNEMKVKKSIKFLQNKILELQSNNNYHKFSDEEESDYYKPTIRHAIIALTHLKEMAEECTNRTCVWEIKS